jgi:MFS family permease
LTTDTPSSHSATKQGRIYYGWVILILAALAMVGTLPGRTVGLGLITEYLLKDLRISGPTYESVNFWATLIGALFGIGLGKLMDRIGSRTVLAGIAAALGLTVLAMARVESVGPLYVLITLTRGLGQAALSAVSLAMVGIWFRRRLNLAMAIYAVVISMGFMTAFPLIGSIVTSSGWRAAWSGIGWALLLGLTPAALLLARRAPSGREIAVEGYEDEEEIAAGSTLGEAVRTGAFWVMGVSSALYGLIASGIAIYNQSVLAERGFPPSEFHKMLAITAMTALLGNFLGGWLASKWSMTRLMSIAMLFLMGGLLALPNISTSGAVVGVSVLMGLAGGFVTVIFFAFWSAEYGRAHLGQIQGAAQALTVLASAVGPALLGTVYRQTGSYASAFYALAIVVAALAAAAWVVRLPKSLNNLETS